MNTTPLSIRLQKNYIETVICDITNRLKFTEEEKIEITKRCKEAKALIDAKRSSLVIIEQLLLLGLNISKAKGIIWNGQEIFGAEGYKKILSEIEAKVKN